MIDWSNPDYVSAGHFYALVSEVNVKCANASGMSSNITSYVYSTNSSAFTPAIAFSNEVSGPFIKCQASSTLAADAFRPTSSQRWSMLQPVG
jgi:hypothetical protein